MTTSKTTKTPRARKSTATDKTTADKTTTARSTADKTTAARTTASRSTAARAAKATAASAAKPARAAARRASRPARPRPLAPSTIETAASASPSFEREMEPAANSNHAPTALETVEALPAALGDLPRKAAAAVSALPRAIEDALPHSLEEAMPPVVPVDTIERVRTMPVRLRDTVVERVSEVREQIEQRIGVLRALPTRLVQSALERTRDLSDSWLRRLAPAAE